MDRDTEERIEKAVEAAKEAVCTDTSDKCKTCPSAAACERMLGMNEEPYDPDAPHVTWKNIEDFLKDIRK